jgi:predicted membrane channel-forming protein YqfA (hemolysin III family)
MYWDHMVGTNINFKYSNQKFWDQILDYNSVVPRCATAGIVLAVMMTIAFTSLSLRFFLCLFRNLGIFTVVRCVKTPLVSLKLELSMALLECVCFIVGTAVFAERCMMQFDRLPVDDTTATGIVYLGFCAAFCLGSFIIALLVIRDNNAQSFSAFAIGTREQRLEHYYKKDVQRAATMM